MINRHSAPQFENIWIIFTMISWLKNYLVGSSSLRYFLFHYDLNGISNTGWWCEINNNNAEAYREERVASVGETCTAFETQVDFFSFFIEKDLHLLSFYRMLIFSLIGIEQQQQEHGTVRREKGKKKKFMRMNVLMQALQTEPKKQLLPSTDEKVRYHIRYHIGISEGYTLHWFLICIRRV